MRTPKARSARRAGKILVMSALLLPVMLGMVGLVIDGGMVMASHRHTQNAADAAALAAAMDILRGRSIGQATTTATKFVNDPDYNKLTSSSVVINKPPTTGPYAGLNDFVEAIVTTPVTTSFIHVLSGVNQSQQVKARAVAGLEAVASGDGAIVLDPTAVPGLTVAGGGHLIVNGRVVVNSQGSGVDENGSPVNLGLSTYASSTGNNSTLEATDIQVVGGVDTPANYKPFVPGDPSPLHARALPEPDPMRNLPTPTTSLGVDSTSRGKIEASGTYEPGVYNSIKLGNGNDVTFKPGIYIIKPAAKNADGVGNISITGAAKVRGNGVMFYLTGENFNPSTGAPDNADGDGPVGSPGTSFGSLTINGSDVQLTGLNNPLSPFNGMLFYQRRWNTQSADIQGGTSSNNNLLAGTIYAKWANFKLAGSGKYDAQFIVGSMALSGTANVTLNYAGKNLGKANQVFLVE